MASHLRVADEAPAPVSAALPGDMFGHIVPINTQAGDGRVLVITLEVQERPNLIKIIALDHVLDSITKITEELSQDKLPKNRLGKLWEVVSQELIKISSR